MTPEATDQPTSFVSWYRGARISESASATSFWLLLSFGPAGLVAINVLGLFIDQQVIASHLIAIANSAPGSFGDLLVTQFTVIASPSPGSMAIDALLVVTSLWTISTAVAMLMRGLRRGYGMPVAPFLILRALASLAGLASIIVLGFLAFAVDASTRIQQVIGIACAAAVVFALILGLHALAVGRVLPWRRLWPGAAFSAIALTLIQLLWERAASLSPSASPAYGAIGGLVTSMIAVWIAVLSILLGTFINRKYLRR